MPFLRSSPVNFSTNPITRLAGFVIGMRTMVLVYKNLQNWVILFVQMLVYVICVCAYSSTMVSFYMGVASTKLDPPTVQLGKTYRKPWILWKLVLGFLGCK